MRKFMRTRPAPPHPPPLNPHPHPAPHLNGHAKLNGHPNGVAVVRRDDQQSTISSRYWSGGSGGSGGGEPLWEDAEFPPCWRALGERRHHNDVVWMRPHELCSRPTFYGQDTEEEGFEDEEANEEFAARWCVEIGELGDGCVCCAAAALSRSPALLARLVPPQSFRKRYNGVFRFKFWEWGSWREVVVDDRLPTRRGRLLTSRSARVDDFTLPLLEKAYAKLYGSYARMRAGGSVSRALQDTTGGVAQSFCLAVTPSPLALQVLHSAAPRSTLIVATLDRPHHTHKSKDGSLRRLENGLIPGQAYCVTGLARVRGAAVAGGRGEEALVRVRSAGGQRGAWRGAWSRGSQQWRALLPHDRDLLDQRATTPDEFWMSFADLVATFSRLELVHIGPDDWMREAALHARRPWRAVLARRRWRPGHSAGGPPQSPTHPYNPHFHLQVPNVEGGSCGGRKCHVVVSVTQQYSCATPRPLLGVGFAVYESAAAPAHHRWGERAPPPTPLDLTHQSTAREVVTFFTLPAGDYVVVPHTARAHLDAAFLLRIYTDLHTNIWEVNEDNMIIREIVHEFPDERTPLTPEFRASLVKLLGKEDVEELDAETLRAALVRGRLWRGGWATRPSLSLCRALVTLRDSRVTGQMPARDLPALTRILHEWKHIFVKLGVEGEGGTCSSHRSRVSSYRLRALLRAAGVAASNKVLECLVLRFARHRTICAEHFLMALTALHLAHERFRSLDAKLKTNPLSLEEVILMTIYS